MQLHVCSQYGLRDCSPEHHFLGIAHSTPEIDFGVQLKESEGKAVKMAILELKIRFGFSAGSIIPNAIIGDLAQRGLSTAVSGTTKRGEDVTKSNRSDFLALLYYSTLKHFRISALVDMRMPR